MTKRISDAVEILKKRDAKDARTEAMIAEEMEKMEIGRQVYGARTELKMSQKRLAAKVGMTSDEIEAIEMADFEGDLLTALHRIAPVIGMKVGVSLIPSSKTKTSKRREVGMRHAHPNG